MRFNLAAELGFVLAMLTDDHGFEVKTATLKNGASCDENVEAFLRNEPADTERSQFRILFGWVNGACEQVGKFSVETVIDAAHVRFWFNFEQVFAVGFGACNHEARSTHFATQQSRWI